MKIKSKSKNKKVIILAVATALAIGSSVVIFALSRDTAKQTTDESSKKSTSSNKQESKESTKDNPEDKNQSSYNDKPTVPSAEDNSSKKRVDLVASVDKSDGMVFIRGGFNYPITEGGCYAQLSGPAGQSIRKDTTLLQNPGSTDCKTISIPVSELSAGEWKFTLQYTSNDYEGVSNEISFTI